MAIRIPTEQIQSLQQIEVAVGGPEGANRLFTIVGQIPLDVLLTSSGLPAQQNETVSVLIGPALTRQQFFRAIGTASLVKMSVLYLTGEPSSFGWAINGVDADRDDESGQVELRIEITLNVLGGNNSVEIGGLGFQVTILAAVAA